MAAPKGNQFWKARATSGRDKIFSSPDELWNACCEYFEWCDNNEWLEKDWVGKDAEEVNREKKVAYTYTGLCLFLDIDVATFRNYGVKDEYKDFFAIHTRITNVIYTQKFVGAANGTFNANIIARDLGLTDKQDLKLEAQLPAWMSSGIPTPNE